MRDYEINMLYDTLNIVQTGSYSLNDHTICLNHSFSELEEAYVYLPEDVAAISQSYSLP